MKTTIIYAHPWEGSFNKAILDEAAEAAGDCYVIDLYKDGFDPVMSEEDLALYSEGKSADPQVEKYNEILDDTSRINFIWLSSVFLSTRLSFPSMTSWNGENVGTKYVSCFSNMPAVSSSMRAPCSMPSIPNPNSFFIILGGYTCAVTGFPRSCAVWMMICN